MLPAGMTAATALILAGCFSQADPASERSTPLPPTATATETAGVSQNPSEVTVGPTSPAPATAACAVNPSSAPVIAVEPYQTVPAPGRISVTLSDIDPGEMEPGGAPVDIEVTICNDSAVDYPRVGVLLVLGHCTCAPNPTSTPAGSVERFDEPSGTWLSVEHPTAGTGMDYLGTYSDVQPLPKGRRMSLRFRVALDESMTTGEGAVEAAAVTPEPLNRIGTAEESFVVGRRGG